MSYDVKSTTGVESDALVWTRRDRFVAAALTGLLASWPPNATLRVSETAREAVEFADATLAEIDRRES